MDRKARPFQPRATALEAKHLLSLMATPAPQAAEVSVTSSRSGSTPAEAIVDTIRGRYAAPGDNRAADAPLHLRLSGAGSVDGVGRARLSGSLDLGGSRLPDSPGVTGTLTLANARGTVKLRLTGADGFAEVPNGQLVATVSDVKGSGAFAGFQRGGTVTLRFGANQLRPARDAAPIAGKAELTLALKPLVK